ncbi:hypothetical protein ACVWWO_004750 [Bradyrhizobium sp. F1.13.1]
MLGFWNSASAISAALRIDCAARPALPDAESGRITATFTPPVPAVVACCGGPAGWAGGGEELLNGLENWLRLCCTPAQADSSGAPSNKPSALRRVAPDIRGP